MFCIPIIARDTEEAIQKMTQAKDLADILELRLDLFETFDVQSLIKASPRPVLVTYRSQKEGGNGKADAQTVADYLITAVQAGADLVDVELSMPQKWRKKIMASKNHSGMVVSSHFKDHTPSRFTLHALFEESLAIGADIVKLVTRAENWGDNLRVLDLIPQAQERGVKISAFCMGPVGRISRIFSHLMGAHLTFASLESGQESASGQIPIHELKEILDYFIV